MEEIYILNGHIPEPIEDVIEWGRWFENANRHVALTQVDRLQVSTVFLGLDHSFGGEIPILFETMIFGGEEEYQKRYATWEQAEAGHKKAVQFARLKEIK